MATLPLKSSRNEQRAVIRFFCVWAKGLNANEIHSEMRPVYGDWGQVFYETSNTRLVYEVCSWQRKHC